MSKYKNEVTERFGSTDAYKEFESKTAGYTEENWQSAESGLNAVFAKFAERKSEGYSSDSAEVQAFVKELKAFISENFYTCTDEILAGFGQMYVADERFRENIDKHGSGTAEFASKAIEIYYKGLNIK